MIAAVVVASVLLVVLHAARASEVGWTGIEVLGDSRADNPAACVPTVVDAHGRPHAGMSVAGAVQFEVDPGTYTVSDPNWDSTVGVTVAAGRHAFVTPPSAEALLGCVGS